MNNFEIVIDFVFQHQKTKNTVQKTVKKKFLAKDAQGARELMERFIPDFKKDVRLRGFDLIYVHILGVIPQIANIDPEKCVGCESCLLVCMKNAIKIQNEKALVSANCIYYGECAKVCPTEAITASSNYLHH